MLYLHVREDADGTIKTIFDLRRRIFTQAANGGVTGRGSRRQSCHATKDWHTKRSQWKLLGADSERR
jgi:aconitase B